MPRARPREFVATSSHTSCTPAGDVSAAHDSTSCRKGRGCREPGDRGRSPRAGPGHGTVRQGRRHHARRRPRSWASKLRSLGRIGHVALCPWGPSTTQGRDRRPTPQPECKRCVGTRCDRSRRAGPGRRAAGPSPPPGSAADERGTSALQRTPKKVVDRCDEGGRGRRPTCDASSRARSTCTYACPRPMARPPAHALLLVGVPADADEATYGYRPGRGRLGADRVRRRVRRP